MLNPPQDERQAAAAPASPTASGSVAAAAGGRRRRTAELNTERRRRIKALLAERDGWSCFYCGQPFDDPAGVSIDHFIPRSLLAGWKLHNLVLACHPCNGAKADRLPQEILRPRGVYRPGLLPAQEHRTSARAAFKRAISAALAAFPIPSA